MVLNTAARMLRDAEELKEKILKFKSGTSMIQERSLWCTQQQLQNIYQKLLVYDLDYALNKKVEQDLWNIGFKQQIDALQAISKDRKNALRSEGQAMLSWVLQAAAGFYLCLLHQICTTFRLDLPFRRRASLLGWVEGWGATPCEGTPGAKLPPPAAARYICQHCLVHLGDLARYKQQLRIAHTFYRHALLVSAHSGQPYNQLALVAWRRARPLSALYWHVRSFLVRSPFPPAPANLARTLAAAAASATQKGRELDKDLPVLPGVTKRTTEASPSPTPARLDAHTYIGEFIRVLHVIHTLDELMACVCIWIAHWSTEGHTVSAEALSESEQTAERAAMSLCVGVILALLLPAYTRNEPPSKVLPSLKVWLQWLCARRTLLSNTALVSRPQLWPALAHTLNSLATTVQQLQPDLYETLPLPEDEELHGFLPLEDAFAGLKFSSYATWDTYGDRIPDIRPNCDAANGTGVEVRGDAPEDNIRAPYEVTEESLRAEPELERRLRAHRLVRLGVQLAELVAEAGGDYFTVNTEGEITQFSASTSGGELLSRAIAELSASTAAVTADDAELDSEEEPSSPPPPQATVTLTQPLIISEADFRQHVREKRVGILKPQGSLERAREERALANTTQQEADEEGDESSKSEEARRDAARRPRMNVAMAAIMRKQEESNKQVKFVTPATTPDSTGDAGETSVKELEKPKFIQPKAIKSLANLPTGRKTGGILSLKDKSAGYPHLVNAEPDTNKPRNEKEEKKESPKQSAGTSALVAPKARQETHPISPIRTVSSAPSATAIGSVYNEAGKLNLLHKNGYGPTNQSNYSNANGQGIKLAVVNPKEIDVRSAALQKQNSRYELFHDGQKLNQNYQFSSDKKNFLNDLPPRFANQYRYWQQANENHFNQENKFKDESYINANPFSAMPQNSPINWPIQQEPYHQQQQQSGWWKPDNNSFNMKYPLSTPPTMNLQQNYYSNNLNSSIGNPFQNSYPMPNQPGLNLQKPEISNTQNYMQTTNTQHVQPLQNVVTSPSFNTPLNSFGNYSQAVGYDTNLYSQYGNTKFNYPSQIEKPLGQVQNNDFSDTRRMNYGGLLRDMQPTNPTYTGPIDNDRNIVKNLDQIGMGGEAMGSTYSLFSGAPEQSAWASAPNTQQSLWSGPSLSPLERLLAQQKQLKQPNDN
ncbi:Protein SMG7 [Eumeta japonica]|uniref:Protein SMG7 n=1 Tax=Eumeta variegata TaxID=151549 RepID=A0A4C1T1H5_EUMVA|nr:Protein SMG7 [Eumeta japonica]